MVIGFTEPEWRKIMLESMVNQQIHDWVYGLHAEQVKRFLHKAEARLDQ